MMEEQWQPIHTAPLTPYDVILLGRAGKKHTMPCHWTGEHWECATIFGQGMPYIAPTHWMPLPAGPDAI